MRGGVSLHSHRNELAEFTSDDSCFLVLEDLAQTSSWLDRPLSFSISIEASKRIAQFVFLSSCVKINIQIIIFSFFCFFFFLLGIVFLKFLFS